MERLEWRDRLQTMRCGVYHQGEYTHKLMRKKRKEIPHPPSRHEKGEGCCGKQRLTRIIRGYGELVDLNCLTVAVKLMPPLSFFLKPILGGCLLRRMPKPSSSCSISFLWPRGLRTSSTMRIRLQVRATEMGKEGT